MAKYKVDAIRSDEYIIEIDENVWNEERLQTFSRYFSEVDDLEDLTEVIAGRLIRLGHDSFHEGFGYFKCKRKDGYQLNTYVGGKKSEDSDFADGITITIISEDNDYDIRIDEVTEE